MGHVVAVNHHRRQRHTGFFTHIDGFEFLNECRFATGLEGFHHLYDQFFTASHRVRLFNHVEPGWRGVTATVRIMPHVRRAPETGQTTAGHG
ncbi:hypothetical protein SRABI106_02513 [Rahnella aquatilis]|nr:hypothetical protein SRABI106_02513 [Rahnella aquatilis]